MSLTPIKIIEHRISTTGLPCDPDTERAAISCMLINQTCIEEALNLDIGDDHFYDSRYRFIYNKIVDIKYLDGANVDLVLLRTKLRESEEFKQYVDNDILVFITEIEEEPIFPANFHHYIELLEDLRQRRKNVAALSGAGGTGKSKLCLYAAISAATGIHIFQCFKPELPRKVICLFGEDSSDVVWERLRSIFYSCNIINPELLIQNLFIYCEQARPLMELEYNKPVLTDAYWWLKKKLQISIRV